MSAASRYMKECTLSYTWGGGGEGGKRKGEGGRVDKVTIANLS